LLSGEETSRRRPDDKRKLTRFKEGWGLFRTSVVRPREEVAFRG